MPSTCMRGSATIHNTGQVCCLHIHKHCTHTHTIIIGCHSIKPVIPLPLTSPGRGFRVVSVVNRFNIQGMTKSMINIIIYNIQGMIDAKTCMYHTMHT